jgi:hypothetical protein
VICIDEKVEKEIRILKKFENRIAQKGRIRLEIIIDGDYRKEN